MNEYLLMLLIAAAAFIIGHRSGFVMGREFALHIFNAIVERECRSAGIHPDVIVDQMDKRVQQP